MHDVLRERARVGKYERDTRLTSWIVHGRYWLNSAGNLAVIDGPSLTTEPVLHMRDGLAFTAGFRSIAPAGSVCERCGEGWTLRDAHDYTPVQRANDTEGRLTRLHFHTACQRFRVADRVRSEFIGVITVAGIQGDLLAVPNRYGSEQHAGPWFTLADTAVGRVTIGWRKRVIQITWERGPDGRKVFDAEATTKDTRLVHAWTYADAGEYLQRLMKATT